MHYSNECQAAGIDQYWAQGHGLPVGSTVRDHEGSLQPALLDHHRILPDRSQGRSVGD